MKISLLLLSITLIQLILFSNCRANNSISYTATYLDVNAPDKLSALSTKITKNYFNLNIPKYIEVSGKLYLIFQVTWKSRFTVEVQNEKWTIEKIRALISKNNWYLRDYFPKPSKPFGGVRWLGGERGQTLNSE